MVFSLFFYLLVFSYSGKLISSLSFLFFLLLSGIMHIDMVGVNRKAKLLFNPQEVLKEYAETEWMAGRVETVAICKMGAQKVKTDDGEEEERYEIVAEIGVS